MVAEGLGSATKRRSAAALLLALLATMAWWADGALASESGRVAAGGTHSCAIKADDTLVCWGSQGGIPAGLGSVDQVAAGGKHDCAIKTDDTPICWGDDSEGQSTLPPGIGTVIQITAGGEHTCAVKTDGTPVCWGDDEWGQSTLPAGIGTVTEITAGEYHSCAIKADETLTCWGSHIAGQLGGSPTFTSGSPPSLVGVGPFSHAYTAEPALGGFGVGELVIRFFLSSGSFPPGLTLDGTTGALTGTPTVEGTYNGVVSATNDVFSPDTQAFSITVDTTAPVAPSGLASSPASPSSNLSPRIVGTAEAGSTVRLYDNETCTGSPRSTGSAGAFASPGLQITVAAGSTTTVYATATDAAGNASGCSASKATYANTAALIAPTDPGTGTPTDPVTGNGDPPEHRACVVPKLAGKTLARAKRALVAAGCKVGTVRRPRLHKGRRSSSFVVKTSTPAAGAEPAGGRVHLTLGPKPRKAHR